MNRVQPRSFGFALAVFLGAWHAFWAFLVWLALRSGCSTSFSDCT